MASVQLRIRPGDPAVPVDFVVEVRDDTPGADYEVIFNGTVIDTMTSNRSGNVRTVFPAMGREVTLSNFVEANKRQRGFLDKGHMLGWKGAIDSLEVIKL